MPLAGGLSYTCVVSITTTEFDMTKKVRKAKEKKVQAPAKAATAAKVAPTSAVPAVPRASANAITRPRAGGKCEAVWEYLDKHPGISLKEAKTAAYKNGWNTNNVVIELYRWRKFNGVQV